MCTRGLAVASFSDLSAFYHDSDIAAAERIHIAVEPGDKYEPPEQTA